MIDGTVYGTALNDRRHRERLADAFHAPPYKAPPQAPVLYIKPRTCRSAGGAPIPIPAGLAQVELASTIGLLFGRDATRASPAEARASVAGACLAIDVSEPHSDYYRPAIRQRCRDGFLPLGDFVPLPDGFEDLVTHIDGVEAHRWSMDRLVRPMFELVAELSQFMTLRQGDLLLVGLAVDAPQAGPGRAVAVSSAGLPSLSLQTTAG